VKTIVVGLGNPILGDDGVGWQIAQELQQTQNIPSDVTIECQAVGGISLMESLIDYDRAIIIDAIITHQAQLGSVNLYTLEDLPDHTSGHMTSAHDTSLQDALKLGQTLGAHLPSEISIITVESQNVYEFSDILTPPVMAAIPCALKLIQELLLESKPVTIPKVDNQTS
jgi:hydrogenase maturation protease